MSGISADEYDLLAFFESEPRRDPDVPWPYDSLTYYASTGEYEVAFGLSPAYGDISLSVRRDWAELYRLVALSVHDVKYRREHGVETLEIVVSERERIFLRLRPALFISQEIASPA